MMKHRFKKKERLKEKKYIQQLFVEGKKLRLSLLNFYYLRSNKHTHQVIFSVPKRLIKKAVERNSIRRKIKEAYRVTKYMINGCDHISDHFFLGYIYREDLYETPTYAKFLADIKRSMLHLQQIRALKTSSKSK